MNSQQASSFNNDHDSDDGKGGGNGVGLDTLALPIVGSVSFVSTLFVVIWMLVMLKLKYGQWRFIWFATLYQSIGMNNKPNID